MKTFIIVPEHSDVLNRFVETVFPGAVEMDAVCAVIQPVESAFGTVCLVPGGHRWPEHGTDDRDRTMDVADAQVDIMYDIFEHGDSGEEYAELDFEHGTRVYVGCSLVIRGTDTDEPLFPRDAYEMRRCLSEAAHSGKVGFSLSVSMLNQSQSKQWARALHGEVRIRPDRLIRGDVVPEGYDEDPVAMFLHLVGLDNGFRWKRKLFEFREDFYGDLKELIYDAVYADCN